MFCPLGERTREGNSSRTTTSITFILEMLFQLSQFFGGAYFSTVFEETEVCFLFTKKNVTIDHFKNLE